ncbi:MAG: VWA domain-containing protein [Methylophilus sp.]|nr:VWA domain-containing protein [Methylophilus sp.]
MQRLGRIRKHYDMGCLCGALLFLLLAIYQPTITSVYPQKNILFIIDVTQSMNVQDMAWKQNPISRLNFTKQLLKETIKQLPCGTQVGLGVFFKTTAALLYTPIETCAHYHVLESTLNHVDWRMASQGNSNIRLGLLSTAALLNSSIEDIAQVVFITDGNEAPPLNVFTHTNLSKWQDSRAWTIMGVGGNKPVPIPKLDTQDNIIGYWSTDAIKLNPASNVDQGHNGGRDNSIATEPYEYYLSQLDASYLQELSTQIGAQYLKATTAEALIHALNQHAPSVHIKTQFALNRLCALISFMLMIAVYVPDIWVKLSIGSGSTNKRKTEIK